VIARVPSSAIPAGLAIYPPGAKYGQAGWLALDVMDIATSEASLLILDLRAADFAPWETPGRLQEASWGPGSVLAVGGAGGVRLIDPVARTVQPVTAPTGMILGDTTDAGVVPPTWLANGTGFLAWQGGSDIRVGRLGLDGVFVPTDAPPAVFQSTGRERRWAANGTELSVGCPTEGGPAPCSVISGLNGGEAEIWYNEASGDGVTRDFTWDAEGDGMWFLLERVTGEGPVEFALAHADAPGQLSDVVVTGGLEPPGVGSFEILGIRDAASAADGRYVLIGQHGATVDVALSGDGAIASFGESPWFAGWAADQGPYPAR
jgi:hypothetical protein